MEQDENHCIKTVVALLGTTLMLAACGKDKSSLIIGTWANTAQSYEITIAGQERIPAGVIGMELST